MRRRPTTPLTPPWLTRIAALIVKALGRLTLTLLFCLVVRRFGATRFLFGLRSR